MSDRSGLQQHYDRIEARLALRPDPSYAGLVVPNGNGARPYHRWFHLKEGYSCDLVGRVLTHVGLDGGDELRILDPFVGAGTTLVSANEWAIQHPKTRVEAVGVEANPFLYFLTETKIASLVARARTLEPNELHVGEPAAIPALSTFHDPRFFEPTALEQLLRLRAAIDAQPQGLMRDLAQLAVACSVEPVSRLRRDGRTLRVWENKPVVDPVEEYNRRLRVMLDDHAGQEPSPASLGVHAGDGRTFRDVTGASAVDLVMFSPPYPNNIDYTEVYKLEAWFLGKYRTRDEFRSQRLRTLRSHPSVKFDEAMGLDDARLERRVRAAVAPILGSIPEDRYRHGRRRMVLGYAADLASTLRDAREVLSERGRVVVVVGNSLHGHGDAAVLVAADLVIAEIARAVGLTPCEILVARRPPRRSRTEPRLRESILILK